MAGVVPPERGGAVHQCFPLYRCDSPGGQVLTTVDPPYHDFTLKPDSSQPAVGLEQPESELLQPRHRRR